MKKITFFVFLMLGIIQIKGESKKTPRLIVTTDINIDSGDPDDRQSMIHLFLYANELDIRGIVIDRIEAGGIDATMQVLECYKRDFYNLNYKFKELNFPHPDTLRSRIFISHESAVNGIIKEALEKRTDPLYIAVWGSMEVIQKCLQREPQIAKKLRVLTIGTDIMSPMDTSVCGINNWNNVEGHRDLIFNDKKFYNLWWIENNWGYNGMFMGDKPKAFLDKLTYYGELGMHMKEVVGTYSWAQYFRAGDTPSIMYFIDNSNLNNPLLYNLGGYFIKPFPKTRPNYYIDAYPNSPWNYAAPCSMWDNALEDLKLRSKEMEKRRDEMYRKFIIKLNLLYNK